MATDPTGLLTRLRRRPGVRLKLLSGMSGLVGLDAAGNVAVSADPRKMTATVRISCETVDHSGDVVVAAGLDLTDHRKIPVVLLEHNRKCPIGKAEDAAGNYTVRLSGPELIGTTYFAQGTREGEEAFHLVYTKVLRGVSVGMIPIAATPNRTGGHRIEKALLIEYSHLTVPDNPDCVVLAVEKGFGGRPYSPLIQRLLMPALPAKRRKVVTGGYTRKDAYDHNMTAGLDVAGGVTDDPMADADLPKVPAGAQALTSLYEWLMQGADMVSDAFEMQENPGVKDHLEGILARVGEDATEVAALFAQEYPDLPALADADVDDEVETETTAPAEGETVEKTDDDTVKDEDDPDGQKALKRRRLRVKCLAMHRRWTAKLKGLTRKAEQVVSEAADHLDEMGGYVGKHMSVHRTSHKAHAKALRSLCGKGMGTVDDTAGGTLASDDPDGEKGLDLAKIEAALKPLASRLEAIEKTAGTLQGK